MRGEPLIIVTRDNCEDELEVSLTSLAGGGWDERGVDGQLRHAGWIKDGERDLCSGCEDETED